MGNEYFGQCLPRKWHAVFASKSPRGAPESRALGERAEAPEHAGATVPRLRESSTITGRAGSAMHAASREEVPGPWLARAFPFR